MTSKVVVLFAAGLCAACFLGCGDEESVAPPKPGPSKPPGPPYVLIDKPQPMTGEQQYAKVIRFGWKAGDGVEPVSIRYLSSLIVDTNGTYYPPFDIIKDLTEHPARYEAKWSSWIPFHAPGDSGRSTLLGDDESLIMGRYYIFAVQARDASGKITETFDARTNVRRFKIKSTTDPFLVIYDHHLGGFRFLGTTLNPEVRDLPPGIPLHFRWEADVSDYRGELVGYRYAWDVPDPSAWDAPFMARLTEAPEVTFHAGVHTLFVEVIDIAGTRSLGRVGVNIVPFPMDRNLLFVDDYYSSNDPAPDYREPIESVHDAFWSRLCSQAESFDPGRDVYDCAENGHRLPGLDLIARYKNIIWTYSASNSSWSTMVSFTPESRVSKTGAYAINYLSMFLMKGGHLWTLGQTTRSGGGLAASLPLDAQSFPMNLKCEIAGNRGDCSGDQSGVNSMPYRDYCVTMLDKVDGVFRVDEGMPLRIRDHCDCMIAALRDDSDPLTAASPGFPERLDLWEEVTKPGRYFNPGDTLGPGGLTYAEIYDPEYWMERSAVYSQYCFHPLYRMQAKADSSALNNCTVAIWVTTYKDVVPEVSSGVAVPAPSFHFGFPLWFFRRSSADSIAHVVFDEWGIRRPQ